MMRITRTAFASVSWAAFSSLLLLLLSANPAHADGHINMTFQFNYTLLADQTTYTLETGLEKLSKAVRNHTQTELNEAEIDATIASYTSELLLDCASPKPSTFPLCSLAGSEMVITADEVLDEDLVERLSLKRVQTFMETFNNDHQDQLEVGYDSPVFVKAAFNVILGNVGTPMEPSEQETFINTILENLGQRLAAGTPPIALDDVKVVVQTPVTGSTPTRRRAAEKEEPKAHRVLEAVPNNRQLNEEEEVVGNRVGMILNGHCGGGETTCFNEKMQEQVDALGGEYASSGDLLEDLKNSNAQGAAPDYFDVINTVQVSDAGVLNVNLTDLLSSLRIPAAPQAGEERVDEEPVPWWIWILVGVSCLVLIVGGTWTALMVTRRNDDALLRQAYDDHHASESKRRGLFAHFGSSKNTNVQQTDQEQEVPHDEDEFADHDDAASPTSQDTGPHQEGSAEDGDEGEEVDYYDNGVGRSASVYDNGASAKFEDENRDV